MLSDHWFVLISLGRRPLVNLGVPLWGFSSLRLTLSCGPWALRVYKQQDHAWEL